MERASNGRLSWNPAPPLEVAFAAVEAVARQRGPAVGPRMGLGSEAEFARLAERCGGEMPADLMAYLRWYDRELWRRFVNNVHSADPEDSAAAKYDLYGIDSLDEVEMLDVAEDDKLQAMVEDLRQLRMRARVEAWRSARLLKFGSSCYSEPLLYVLSAPGYRRGTILTTVRDDPTILWLADSLAQWLARLAACDGVEYAFGPGGVNELEPGVRRRYVKEFSRRNPWCSFFWKNGGFGWRSVPAAFLELLNR